MNLNTERKVKFWLSTITKVLIIALVLFKLIPYVFEEKNETNIIVDDLKESTLKETIMADTVNHTNTQNKVKSNYDTKGKKVEEVPIKNNSALNTLSIIIFNKTEADRVIINQLEKTIFLPYHIKPFSSTPNKEQLFSGNYTAANGVEKVCIGSVSYIFKENASSTSCELKLEFDTYSTLTGLKIKEFSTVLIRYGIGFSKEQAKQVAIKKINSI